MKKKLIISGSLIFVVMFVLPMLIGLLADSRSILGFGILDFYVVSPVFSIFIGIFTGKQFKKMWYIPIASAVLFMLSSWIFLSYFGDFTFVIYSCGYAALGIISALLTFLVSVNNDKSSTK